VEAVLNRICSAKGLFGIKYRDGDAADSLVEIRHPSIRVGGHYYAGIHRRLPIPTGGNQTKLLSWLDAARAAVQPFVFGLTGGGSVYQA
jgi:hypothetical protein